MADLGFRKIDRKPHMTKKQAPGKPPVKSNSLVRLPGVLVRIQVSRSTWLKGVKDGRYPAGIMLGPRTRAWLSSDIDDFIQTLSK